MPANTTIANETPDKKSVLKTIIADDYTPSERKVQVIIQYMIIGGLVMLVMINARHFWFPGKASYGDQFAAMLTGFGYAVLVGGACFGIGALVGFLFGIPRLLEADSKTGTGGLTQNDNLVQISDWLTKIIVGVGLTQLSSLSGGLLSIGKTMAPSFSATAHPELGVNLAIGTVLYFTVTGFLSGYLWTRIHFYRLLAQTSGDVRSLEAKLNQANEEKAQAEAGKAEAEEKRVAMELEKQEAETKMEEAKLNEQKKQRELMAISKDNVKDAAVKTAEAMFISDDNNDDPHAGQFGRSAEQNGRQLTASVEVSSFDSERYLVCLEVISTDSSKPLEGDAVFYLHPTFRNPERTVAVANGKAELDLIAWGSFTVGVTCDNGNTKLELDLAKLPDVPQKFAER